MRIVSVSENHKLEKRIAITPDIAKKYIAHGFQISISEKYGEHLGFKDSDFKELGVKISNNESEMLTRTTLTKFDTFLERKKSHQDVKCKKINY